MKTQKLWILFGVMFSLGLLASTVCQAGPPPRGPMPRPALIPPGEILTEMNLSETQIQNLEQMQFEHRKNLISLHAKAEAAELDLEHLMRGKNVNEDKLTDAVDKLNTARGNLFKADMLFEFKVRRLVGDEVFLKMKSARPPEGEDRDDFPPRPPAKRGCSR